MVTPVQFGLAAAEREVFEAQLHLDDRDFFNAWHVARGAMLQAARTLVSEQLREIPDGPEVIIREFRKRFYDTKLFFDDYASGKFANYLFRRYQEVPAAFTGSTVRRIIEEAQLFIEASHVCHTRLMVRKTPGNGTIRKLKRTELAKSRNVIDMEIQRFGIKIYLEEDQGFYPKDLIPVFHGWIQNDLIPHHLVIDGTDNFPTRYLVNDICAFLGKPNVYGSIYQFSGQVSLFYAKEGPCYRCLFPEPPRPARVGAFLRRGRRIGGVAGHCG